MKKVTTAFYGYDFYDITIVYKNTYSILSVQVIIPRIIDRNLFLANSVTIG